MSGWAVVSCVHSSSAVYSRNARSLRYAAWPVSAILKRRSAGILKPPAPPVWVCWAHQPLFPSAVIVNDRLPPSSTYLSVCGSGLSCRYWKNSLLRGSVCPVGPTPYAPIGRIRVGTLWGLLYDHRGSIVTVNVSHERGSAGIEVSVEHLLDHMQCLCPAGKRAARTGRPSGGPQGFRAPRVDGVFTSPSINHHLSRLCKLLPRPCYPLPAEAGLAGVYSVADGDGVLVELGELPRNPREDGRVRPRSGTISKSDKCMSHTSHLTILPWFDSASSV